MVAIAPASGPHFTNPKEFVRWLVSANNLNNYTPGDTVQASSAAGFFTSMAFMGLADNTNWTASTYKTLLSVSGAGYIANLVGPTGLAGTPTTTWRITVDGGAAVTVAVTATTTTQRAVLGPLLNRASMTAVTQALINTPDSMSAGKDTMLQSTLGQYMPNWQSLNLFGSPLLRFKSSILIEAQSSENNSTTTNQEKQSAITYRVQS